MTRISIGTLALFLFVSVNKAAIAGDEHDWQAHYLANAGVMVARGDTKVMFDPFFRNGFGQYDLVPEEMEQAIFAGEAPYDGVDAIFVSHYHGDHFDPAVMMRYLEQWPSVRLYAPKQAADALLAEVEAPPKSLVNRVHGLSLERDDPAVQLHTGDIIIEAVRIAHGGWPNRHVDVENMVFRVTLDSHATVMHLGDADAGPKHYEAHDAYWKSRSTDLAMVPVWLMLTDRGRHVLDEHVDADHELGIHVFKRMPDDPEERPAELQGLDIFTEPGEVRTFD